MNKKDEVQRSIINSILGADFRGIVLSSVRSGKTRILLKAIQEHSPIDNPRVIVFYPNIDIKQSWLDECQKIDCPMDITYCTFVSMEKMLEEEADYYIFDEAHLIPEENKLPIAGEIARKNKHVIFASGTYNVATLCDIRIHTQMKQIVNYSTEDAIADGLVLDFDVYIHVYSLDNTKIRTFSTATRRWKGTDFGECERLTEKVNKARFGNDLMIAALSRQRFINSNESLIGTIRRWIKENPGERFIMFTENEKFGKNFNIPMFNSKSKDNADLRRFQAGEIDGLCLIKKGSAGITYPNLRNILITAINSNGETLEQMVGRALLTDTERANIHVFVSDKEFQLKWLKSALYNIKSERIFGLEVAKQG